jgi:hypothetical protein
LISALVRNVYANNFYAIVFPEPILNFHSRPGHAEESFIVFDRIVSLSGRGGEKVFATGQNSDQVD